MQVLSIQERIIRFCIHFFAFHCPLVYIHSVINKSLLHSLSCYNHEKLFKEKVTIYANSLFLSWTKKSSLGPV